MASAWTKIHRSIFLIMNIYLAFESLLFPNMSSIYISYWEVGNNFLFKLFCSWLEVIGLNRNVHWLYLFSFHTAVIFIVSWYSFYWVDTAVHDIIPNRFVALVSSFGIKRRIPFDLRLGQIVDTCCSFLYHNNWNIA